MDLSKPRPNDFEIRGDVAIIFLRRENGPSLECVIDAVDLPKAQSVQCAWCAKWNETSKTFYVRINGSRARQVPGMFLHRFLLDVYDPSVQIDHHDHDGLNNRRGNLRIGDRSLNQFNRHGADRDRIEKLERHVYRGIDGVFFVTMRFRGKDYYGGRFTDYDEACQKARALRTSVNATAAQIVVVPRALKPKRFKKLSYICVVCGKAFRSLYNKRLVCSPHCRAKHNNPKIERAASCALCPRPVESRIWCHKHYRSWRLYGDPMLTKKPRRGGGVLINRSEWESQNT